MIIFTCLLLTVNLAIKTTTKETSALNILSQWNMLHEQYHITPTKFNSYSKFQKMKSAEKTNKWLLQDSSTNAYESIVVYTELDADSLQSVMTGCDSSKVAVLPYGFSILPDGLETKPLLITMRKEEKSSEGGSLLTVAYQFHANSSPLAKLTTEFVENVTSLVSCTLLNIKKAFQCEDG